MGPLLVLVISLGAMWLLFILPQQRRVRAHQAVVARLQVGDEVMTTAGLYGTVVDLDDEVVHLEVAAGTVIRVARGAVGRRLAEEQGAAADEVLAGGDGRPGDEGAGAGPATGSRRARLPRPLATAADRAAALDAPPDSGGSSDPSPAEAGSADTPPSEP